MKKILTLTLLAFALTGCDNSENNTTEANPQKNVKKVDELPLYVQDAKANVEDAMEKYAVGIPCEALKDIKSNTWTILCFNHHHLDGWPTPLFGVTKEDTNDKEYTLFTINGKADQYSHAKNFELPVMKQHLGFDIDRILSEYKNKYEDKGEDSQ